MKKLIAFALLAAALIQSSSYALFNRGFNGNGSGNGCCQSYVVDTCCQPVICSSSCC